MLTVPRLDAGEEDGDVGAEAAGGLTLSLNGFWSSYRELILYQLFPPARVKPCSPRRAT